jgi:hypothetical protein
LGDRDYLVGQVDDDLVLDLPDVLRRIDEAYPFSPDRLSDADDDPADERAGTAPRRVAVDAPLRLGASCFSLVVG